MDPKFSRIPPIDLVLTVVFGAVGAWIGSKLPAPISCPYPIGQFMIYDAGDLSTFFIFAAALVLCFHTLLRKGSGPLFSRRVLSLLCFPLGLTAYVCYDRVAATKTTILPWPGGERYFWLDDDMMISMRYALNLSRGHGLVWNPGEAPVEGITNFLWALILSIPHLIGLPLRLTSGFVIGLNCMIFAGCIVLAWSLCRHIGLRPPLRFLAVVLIAANRWIVYWTVSGSESLLLCFLLLAAAWLILTARPQRRFGILGGLVLGLIELTRGDGLILILALLPALWVIHLHKRLSMSALIVPAVIIVAHFAFRLTYYGALFPNTYYLKGVDLPMKEAMGIHYIHFLFLKFGGICVLQLASFQLARSPLVRALAVIPWFAIGYATLMGGDELAEFRFIVPVIPLLILGGMLSAQTIFLRPRRTGLGAPGAAATPARPVYGWLMVVIVISTFRSLCLPNALADMGLSRAYAEKNNVRTGLLLNRFTDPEARIAHFWAGAAPYFSDRPALDLLGKNDPYIARLPGKEGQWVPGHNKYDLDYSLAQKPDVIVSAGPANWMEPEVRAREQLAADYPGLFAIYDDATFQTYYQQNSVRIPLTIAFHELFVREGTELAAPHDQWEEATD